MGRCRYVPMNYYVLGDYMVYCDRCSKQTVRTKTTKEDITSYIVCPRCVDKVPGPIPRPDVIEDDIMIPDARPFVGK